MHMRMPNVFSDYRQKMFYGHEVCSFFEPNTVNMDKDDSIL